MKGPGVAAIVFVESLESRNGMSYVLGKSPNIPPVSFMAPPVRNGNIIQYIIDRNVGIVALDHSVILRQLQAWECKDTEITKRLFELFSGDFTADDHVFVFVLTSPGITIISRIACICMVPCKTAILSSYIVAPYLRGDGLGRRGVGMIIQMAKKLGYEKLLLVPTKEARAFWEKVGFAETEERRVEVLFANPNPNHEVPMTLDALLYRMAFMTIPVVMTKNI